MDEMRTDRRNVLTVTQLNTCIKTLIEGADFLRSVYIKGEISNFTNHYKTGHFYFTLKDEGSLLKAVMDGVVKFSASDVIEKYRLNSSANVRRVKDALKKKEVLTFNEKDEPVVLDPLFEYWLEKSYFDNQQ